MTNKKMCVLVVDDEPNNLQLMRQILQDEYRLALALDGNKALKAVHQVHPDLILLDIIMEGIDGFEVCQEIKADKTFINIIPGNY